MKEILRRILNLCKITEKVDRGLEYPERITLLRR